MLPPGEVWQELEASGVTTASLGMRRGIGDPRAVWRLATWLRDWRPDVLHAHMVHANLLARVTRLLVPLPVPVCTIHSQNQGSRWRNWAYRATDRLSDVTTAVSDRARSDAIEAGAVPGDRVITVANGVDLSVYRADDAARARVRTELGVDDCFVWLAVGRLTRAKNPQTLIEAFRRLDGGHRRSRLLMAGRGDLLDDVKATLDGSGIAGDVELLGIRDDVPDLMRAADGYVMSSAWEGLPLVLLEAAATSLPIVATDVGGNATVVMDETSGFIVPPGSPEALAAAMQRLQDTPASQRQAMGQAGRAHVIATYDLEAVLDTWERLYRDALVRKGAARVVGR
jgi:glycosyltransferase involved in cell wall biosynthesis